MKYRIQVIGMHCMGCKNLIVMSLEEVGYKSILLDFKTGEAIFETSSEPDEVKRNLNHLFAQFESYSFAKFERI